MFKKVKELHFVGIGGVGMIGLAEVMLNQGYIVSGSDLRDSEGLERLREKGARIAVGHSPDNIGSADLLIISSAVRGSNPEIQAAAERKIPIIRRADMLGELMRQKKSIGVAGTHGKTTTSSMIGEVLSTARLDPTIIVGGRVVNLDSNSKLGLGEYLVAECDEFDRSFLKMMPMIAVITTLEAEHLDCYKDLEDIKRAFLEFANKVPFYGAVLLCLDEVSVQSLIPEIEKRIITYGFSSQADIRAHSVSFNEQHTTFRVDVLGQDLGEVALNLTGMHNIKNALAAIGVGLELGIEFDVIREALGTFQGVRRRFEIKGKVRDILVVDDYAHHPTEVQASLDGARLAYNRRIVTVFQPHLYSRTRDFYREFGRAFFQSDLLILTDVYPAREDPIPGVTGELIARAAREYGHRNVIYEPVRDRIPALLKGLTRPGDLVITMGAGDIYRIGESFLSLLENGFTNVNAAGGRPRHNIFM